MLGASVVLLILHFPFPSSGYELGYVIGSFITQIVSWVLILGVIAYLVGKLFDLDRIKILFIFAVLFFLAALFQFLIDVAIGFLVYG